VEGSSDHPRWRGCCRSLIGFPRPEKYCNTIPSIDIVRIARKWIEEVKKRRNTMKQPSSAEQSQPTVIETGLAAYRSRTPESIRVFRAMTAADADMLIRFLKMTARPRKVKADMPPISIESMREDGEPDAA
jgi:hypothetical protein